MYIPGGCVKKLAVDAALETFGKLKDLQDRGNPLRDETGRGELVPRCSSD